MMHPWISRQCRTHAIVRHACAVANKPRCSWVKAAMWSPNWSVRSNKPRKIRTVITTGRRSCCLMKLTVEGCKSLTLMTLARTRGRKVEERLAKEGRRSYWWEEGMRRVDHKPVGTRAVIATQCMKTTLKWSSRLWSPLFWRQRLPLVGTSQTTSSWSSVRTCLGSRGRLSVAWKSTKDILWWKTSLVPLISLLAQRLLVLIIAKTYDEVARIWAIDILEILLQVNEWNKKVVQSYSNHQLNFNQLII